MTLYLLYHPLKRSGDIKIVPVEAKEIARFGRKKYKLLASPVPGVPSVFKENELSSSGECRMLENKDYRYAISKSPSVLYSAAKSLREYKMREQLSRAKDWEQTKVFCAENISLP